MAVDQDNPREMPRLLEPGWVPAPSQARRFWEYLHRWRVSLFHQCIREARGDTQPADLARLVDQVLRLSDVRRFPIPSPMTAEQMRLCRVIGDVARQAALEGALAVPEQINALTNRLFESGA